MVARHCVINSAREIAGVGPSVYQLDLNVALTRDQELAGTLAENLGMPLPLTAALWEFPLFFSLS